ncbi:hypothetical protein CgunFtcFv8_022117 [Champsocephalus gunnari]|uniref:Uncharacterized protein n=1 Tax=Champsocephalus gunnari TaxID=52237 RepID=A0AAN8DQN9_CHAGU|nr:hypothetical protein CgunFtcFv8_022117 [Champsocephalus gunnari]
MIIIWLKLVAERCRHSKPANNRPFMMPCNAMMILLCPPPTPHPAPASTAAQECGPASYPLPPPPATIATTTTTSPVLPPSQPKPLFSPNKKDQEVMDRPALTVCSFRPITMQRDKRSLRSGVATQSNHSSALQSATHTPMLNHWTSKLE